MCQLGAGEHIPTITFPFPVWGNSGIRLRYWLPTPPHECKRPYLCRGVVRGLYPTMLYQREPVPYVTYGTIAGMGVWCILLG